MVRVCTTSPHLENPTDPMECLFAVLAVFALGVPIVGVILGAMALSRVRRLEARTAELDLEMARLRQGASAPDGASAEPPAVQPPEPAVAPTSALPQEPPSVRARPPQPALETTALEKEPLPKPPPVGPPTPTVPRPEPPPAPSGVPPSEPPSKPTERAFDWERWIGVRGAAAVAGILLALAGLYFVRYSIEAGWLAPPVRVALGLAAGIVALTASEVLRRRGYPDAGNGLAGGGVVVLYAAVWAARILYALIPTTLAFGLMVLVTAVCGLLAWRRASLVVAALGLVGGFATPLLVGAETDSPLGLFGYLLVLNLGLLVLARQRRWPVLPPLSLLATLFYEVLWISSGMEPGELLLALGILVVFTALFVAAGLRPPAGAPGKERAGLPLGLWRGTRVAALLLPFVFGLYFASRADLGEHLWPVAAMLLVLSVAAEALARGWMGEGELGWLGPAAAAAAVGVVAVWALGRAEGVGAAWELTGIAAALAVAFHVFFELDLRREPKRQGRGAERTEGLEPAFAPTCAPTYAPTYAVRQAAPWPLSGALVAASGLFALLILDALVDPGPYTAARLAGWALLAALLTRQSVRAGQGWVRLLAAIPLGVAFPLFHLAHWRSDTFPEPALFFGLLVAAEVVLLALTSVGASFRASSQRGRSAGAGREVPAPWPERAAGALPLAALVALTAQADLEELAPWLYLATTVALAALATLAATRMTRPDEEGAPSTGSTGGSTGRLGGGLGGGPWLFAAMLLTALDQLLWSFDVVLTRGPAVPPLGQMLAPGSGSAFESTLEWGLGAGALVVLFFTVWPFLARPRLDGERWAWYAAALAGPLWFPTLRNLWLERFGAGAVGLLAVSLGAVALAATFRVRSLWNVGDRRRLRGLVWFAAVALGFAALAVPLQLDREWVTLGWALEGVAMIALWRRLDHPGLKLFGVALLVTAAARLLLLAVEPEGPAAPTAVGWLAYTHLIPAAALVGASLLLLPLEVGRLRARERLLYPGGRPVGAAVCGAGAILVVFVWINRTVAEVFRDGAVPVTSTMAHDLTLSLAWALYALVLLGLGFGRSSRTLRGIGLGLMTLTVVKVFLLDLSDLEDLYRVACLAGLAVSLLLVSLAYQRFVFRRSEPEGGRVPSTDGEDP